MLPHVFPSPVILRHYGIRGTAAVWARSRHQAGPAAGSSHIVVTSSKFDRAHVVVIVRFGELRIPWHTGRGRGPAAHHGLGYLPNGGLKSERRSRPVSTPPAGLLLLLLLPDAIDVV